MGCVNCKKARGLASAEVPAEHGQPLQYGQHQKGLEKNALHLKNDVSPGGSETQQGLAESSVSPADSLLGTGSPALSCPGIQTRSVGERERAPTEHGGERSTVSPQFALTSWPEGLSPEADAISIAAQQEALQEWLQGSRTPTPNSQQQQQKQQQQQQQQQQRQRQHEMIVPMRSNDYYGYSRANQSSPPSQAKQQKQKQQKQQQPQQLKDKRDLSVETLACVRRGFDACVLRDARAAELELCKAESLYAALCSEGDPSAAAAAAAAAALRRFSAAPSLKWTAASPGSSSSSSLGGLDGDLEKRIINLRDTLKDMQRGYLAGDARRTLFTHTPPVPLSPPNAAAAAAAAAAQRQASLVQGNSSSRQLTA
ncbi:hypothetical protein Emed_004979 [Eimeria media]